MTERCDVASVVVDGRKRAWVDSDGGIHLADDYQTQHLVELLQMLARGYCAQEREIKTLREAQP